MKSKARDHSDRHLDITFGLQSSSLVSVLFREEFSHPYIFFFHLLVNTFCVTGFRTFFRRLLPFLVLVYGIGAWGGIKMASASTHKLMSQPKTSFSPHSTANTNDKSTNLRKNGISDVGIASVHSEKTHRKKLMMIIQVTEKPFTSK